MEEMGVVPFPPSQDTSRLASIAVIFPVCPRFLLFSHTAEPGPRLRVYEKRSKGTLKRTTKNLQLVLKHCCKTS